MIHDTAPRSSAVEHFVLQTIDGWRRAPEPGELGPTVHLLLRSGVMIEGHAVHAGDGLIELAKFVSVGAADRVPVFVVADEVVAWSVLSFTLKR